MNKASASAMAIGLLALLAVHAVSPALAEGPLPWHQARQMVLVVTPDWNADHGQLRRFVRKADGWHEVGAAWPVTIGKSGAAWGIGLSQPRRDGHPVKREGDGRSPAGVFAIGEAFGYSDHADTALEYVPMHADSYCVDVSGSPYYNRIVRESVAGKAAVKDASEHMRLDLVNNGDQRYRLGFVIEHNPRQKPMAGSCIFAHLWKRPGAPTVGCTAMAAPDMDILTGWLKPGEHPVFVLLPREAWRRLHKTWQLPAADNPA